MISTVGHVQQLKNNKTVHRTSFISFHFPRKQREESSGDGDIKTIATGRFARCVEWCNSDNAEIRGDKKISFIKPAQINLIIFCVTRENFILFQRAE